MNARWARLLVLPAALLAVSGGDARGQDDAGGDEAAAADRCLCERRQACWHFLRAPVSAPDPCDCPKCRPGAVHDGQKVPEGWNRSCFERKSMACFLKRHAASWRVACSACLEDADCCKEAQPAKCPRCGPGDGPSPWRKDAAATLAERMEVERKRFARGKPVIAVGTRFYVVTDVDSIRVTTPHDGARVVDGHEYAHILVTRAERAYRDFCRAFGTPRISRPVGIFVPQRDKEMASIREAYFRNEKAPLVYSAYASASESAISEGFCLNGLCVSVQRVGGSDAGVHQAVRHFLGNIFFTTWIVSNGELRTTPPWAFEGVGHWLGKLTDATRDEVYYLEGEVGPVSGSGKNWERDAALTAAKNGFRPIQEILSATSLGRLAYRDFQQCWAYFHVANQDVPREWAALLADLRRMRDVNEAFRANLGWTPEEFHGRFVDRLAGRRKTLRDGPAETVVAGGPISQESDPAKAVARIRALGPPRDAAKVRDLLDACGRPGDAVRETALLALARTKDEAALAAIPQHGLAHGDPKVRASAARLVRTLRLAAARDALRKLLGDETWYVQAEAVLAAAAIRDFDAQATMRSLLADGSPKLRIAAADALRTLGEDANRLCVPLLAKCLDRPDWQVRVAACEALAVVGDVEAASALVRRMPTETSRVFDEIRAALRALTGEDLGPKPESWRSWWEREEKRARERGKFLPPPKAPEGDPRYARVQPEFWGVEMWSARVGFVVDASRSTNRLFTPPQDVAARLIPGKTSSTIPELQAAEIAWTLRQCDERTRFTVWAFSDDVFRWQSGLVPATAGNVDSAAGFVRNRTPDGETDFHAALRAALGYDATDRWSASLPEGPDTITFVTDGTATTGELTDPDALLAWFAEANRWSRVKVHTVAFGALGVDEPLLMRLASSSEGEFRQVREIDPK
jgi:hypothetical protein